MQCPKCNCSLSIAKAHIEFEGDTSPNTPTKAFNCLDMVCTNKDCDNYSGNDLSNPNKIVEVLRQPLN